MYQETIGARVAQGYRSMAFSKRVLAAVGAGEPPALRTAMLDEALAALALARKEVDGLAADGVVAEVLAHNPDIIQIVNLPERQTNEPVFLAYLPLNPAGAAALSADRFDAGHPDLRLICRPGETPAAIHIWLIFAPGALLPALRALAPLMGRLAPAGCPLFTRAATGHAARLFPAIGFVPASQFYPGAGAGLLVLAPRAGCPVFEPVPTTAAEITVRVARTLEDMMKCFSVRAATYMAEQDCPYEEEFDGNDFCATHFVGEIDGEPAGCIRVRYFADFVKVERLAVRHEFRASRLSFRLVREALAYCRRKGYRRAYGHSRSDLTRFWGLFGFRPVAGKPNFRFSEVDYIELEAELASAEDRLAIGDDPYVLIRPEGDWDRPGPLDRSALRRTTGVSRSSASHARTRPAAPAGIAG